MVFLAGTTGIFCGLAALLFFWSTELIFALLVEYVAGLNPARPAGDPALHLGEVPPLVPVFLAIMTLSGLLVLGYYASHRKLPGREPMVLLNLSPTSGEVPFRYHLLSSLPRSSPWALALRVVAKGR